MQTGSTTQKCWRSGSWRRGVVAAFAMVVAVCFTVVGWTSTNPAVVVLSVEGGQADRDVGPAQMDHWRHQDDFLCYACHPALFSRSGGTKGITHAGMLRGEHCGACHNGKVAFRVDRADPDLDCEACHVD